MEWVEGPAPPPLVIITSHSQSAKPTPTNHLLTWTIATQHIQEAPACSRATVYRTRDDWLARDLIEAVGRNRYIVLLPSGR